MKEEVNNLKNITINADSKIKNLSCPCFNDELDIWVDYEDCERFKFCPFCGRVLKRTINIKENSILAYSFFKEEKD